MSKQLQQQVSNNCPAYSQCTQPHPIHVVFLNLVLQSMTSRHKSDEKMCFVCSCRFMFASICLTKLIIIKKICLNLYLKKCFHGQKAEFLSVIVTFIYLFFIAYVQLMFADSTIQYQSTQSSLLLTVYTLQPSLDGEKAPKQKPQPY